MEFYLRVMCVYNKNRIGTIGKRVTFYGRGSGLTIASFVDHLTHNSVLNSNNLIIKRRL